MEAYLFPLTGTMNGAGSFFIVKFNEETERLPIVGKIIWKHRLDQAVIDPVVLVCSSAIRTEASREIK